MCGGVFVCVQVFMCKCLCVCVEVYVCVDVYLCVKEFNLCVRLLFTFSAHTLISLHPTPPACNNHTVPHSQHNASGTRGGGTSACADR
jgi:hypothetical protein